MKRRQQGNSLIEVILSLLLLGMVFTLVLPGLYLVHRLEDEALVNRQKAAVERMMTIYFKKQVYQTDVIYNKSGDIYLQDLETSAYYDCYHLNGQTVMRKKFRLSAEDTLVSIGLGGNSQFEAGFQMFSISIRPENQRFILIAYQLTNEGDIHEIFIEHGKEVRTIQ